VRLRAFALVLAACGGAHHAATVHNDTPPPPADAAPTCAAKVDRGAIEPEVYASWTAAWTALDADGMSDDDPPADDQSAHDYLCSQTDCAGDGPWILSSGGYAERTYHLATKVPEGILVFANLATGMGGRCGHQPDVELTPGNPVRVAVDDAVDDMFDQDEGGEACFATGRTFTDYFFDLDARTELLAVTREGVTQDPEAENLLTEDWHDPAPIDIGASGVRIAACDRTLSYAP
jgi:hypothetical protein